MRFCVLTLGCKVNAYESEYVKERFLDRGYVEVNVLDNPDIVVINTCSVTNQSDKKSRQMIRMARRENPKAVLAVMGCSAQNHKEDLTGLGIDILIGNSGKSKVDELVEEYLKNRERIISFQEMSDVTIFEDMLLKSERDKTRAFVKIQDGCDNFCSYCIIPYMRGNIRSKDIDVAFKEIDTLVEMGHAEIVLTGIHTGSYGRNEEFDLVDLIKKISTLEGLKRIRISSIEITELNDKFMEEFAKNPKICDHLHIPLQSGCDEILEKMNRKYDTDYYRKTIAKIRSIRSSVSITTDLIVGFPYETDEYFEKTFEFLKEIGFTKIHTFPFSLRSGTKAEEMADYFVNDTVKKERVKRVLDLSLHLERTYYEKFLGQTLDVIVETSKDGISHGHTSNYIAVEIEETLKEGATYSVQISSIDGQSVKGKLKR